MANLLLWTIVILLVAFFALFYWQAPLLYRHQKKMRDENPTLFKIMGTNTKYLNDEGKWVRHYRIYVSLIGLLLIAILLVMLLSIQ
jgi:lipopolysaccharide export system protein LptC